MKIDWNEAPEWAIAHGLKATGMGIKECWLGDEMYQQLDQQKAFLYGGNGHHESGYFYNSSRDSFSYVTQRPASWTGAGLPPVGTVCELKHRVLLAAAHDSKWFDEGDQVEVGGHAFFTGAEGSVCTVCVVGQNYTGTMIDSVLRPIRTPEQIAAEEREKGIQEMREAAGSLNNFPFEQLYDAGYRKVGQ